jgi:hypothetical protein
MIEPVLSAVALLQDIEKTTPGAGEIAVWWLGQSGYALKSKSALIYIDLYLSEHLTKKYANTEKPHIRMSAAPLRGHEITHARWVFASHKHSDHLDPGTLPDLFAASPDAKLVLPAALVDHAAGLGIARERLIAVRGDETAALDGEGFRVYVLPSSHPDLDYNESRWMACGCITAAIRSSIRGWRNGCGRSSRTLLSYRSTGGQAGQAHHPTWTRRRQWRWHKTRASRLSSRITTTCSRSTRRT